MLPRHAIEIVPPGTVSMLLPGDGLAVGDTDDEAACVGDADGDGDGDTDSVGDADTDVEGEPLVVAVGVGVGVGVGDVEGGTTPPTAAPSTQMKTYSMPGGLGRVADGDGDFAGGLEGGGAGGDVEGVTFTGAILEAVGVGGVNVGVWTMTGGAASAVGVRAAELAEAAEADCAATCLLMAPGVVIRPWLPLTSRPTRSTAVYVTAVMTTQESSQPSARVSGRPGRRRLPSRRATNRRHHDPRRSGPA